MQITFLILITSTFKIIKDILLHLLKKEHVNVFSTIPAEKIKLGKKQNGHFV